MGIRFLDSILALVTTCLVVFSAYLIGHALSNDHAAWAWISAPIMMAGGLLLGWFTSRRIRRDAQERGQPLHD